MDGTIGTVLAIWGALLSTVLGVVELLKHLGDRARILVEADLSFRPTEPEAATKGTRVQTKHGWQEVLLSIRMANRGRRPMQITACVVEENNGHMTQVIPDQMPVVLDPNTSLQVEIQKEWLDEGEVTFFGVVDALGRKHGASGDALLGLLRRCRELPTNRKQYRHKETGELVTAFQAKDQAVLSRRRKDT